MSESTSAVPNPGSEGAVMRGCTCPVLDNRRGKGLPMHGGTRCFWINEGCPVHAPALTPEQP
jgi:hypothetical protein